MEFGEKITVSDSIKLVLKPYDPYEEIEKELDALRKCIPIGKNNVSLAIDSSISKIKRIISDERTKQGKSDK